MRTFKIAAGLTLLIVILAAGGGCGKQALTAAPVYLPAAYYDCIAVTSGDLVNNYFSTYGNLSMAESNFNDKYFVFKNVPVKDWMLVDVDKGWIWVGSGVKCLLANPDAMNGFKLEARIDVVGYNTGVIAHETPGLMFKDCYVIPAGSVQLPAGYGGGFIPVY